MDVKFEESWRVRLRNEFEKPYFENLMIFVNQAYKTSECYPHLGLIFNAFDRCTFEKTRVVILGQDPYHGPRQANGLSFSVNDGVTFPPSLINIFKELIRLQIYDVFLKNASLFKTFFLRSILQRL
jgi:uracil-DNA glycosylase